MDLSIVTTLYYSAPYLEEFYRRICAAASDVTDNYEIILVNDGSPDNSLELAIALYERDARVRVIDLSRNFGHHKAIMTGLAHARGDMIFLIDCDLEEKPEMLGKFYNEFKKSTADVIYGVQQARKGGLFERITGHIFYKLLNLMSNYPIPENLTTIRLMSKRYVASLLEHREREIVIGGLWAITGYKQVSIVANKSNKGSSTYNLGKKISFLFTSIASFSNKPLVFIFHLGLAISGMSTIAALYLVMRKLFYGEYLAGWPSLIVSIWFLGGVVIFCLGIIGIYLSKIFIETKQRPYTIIRQIYERNV
jgi:putative glycosyltransferase